MVRRNSNRAAERTSLVAHHISRQPERRASCPPDRQSIDYGAAPDHFVSDGFAGSSALLSSSPTIDDTKAGSGSVEQSCRYHTQHLLEGGTCAAWFARAPPSALLSVILIGSENFVVGPCDD
jgi:hypothetical protein